MSGSGPGSDASRGARDALHEVESTLRRFFAERSDGSLAPDAIDRTRHLFDAGYLDSMSSLALLDFIEERYGVEVPEVELVGGLGTLASLAEYVAERSTPPR
jgi:acyl carrier protein